MALGDISDPGAVRQALVEFDPLGCEEFLAKYGVGGAKRYLVVEGA